MEDNEPEAYGLENERVHIFGCGDPARSQDRVTLRTIARILTADCDCTVNERYARAMDALVGGDDALVGANYFLLIAMSSDPRPVVERELMASDILRQAPRTRH